MPAVAVTIVAACGGRANNRPFPSTEAAAGDGAPGVGDGGDQDTGPRDLFSGEGGGSSGATDAGGAGDASGCPLYQVLCGGRCLETNQDPSNCGGCGHACPPGQACSAGTCSGSCTTPTNGGTVQIVKCGQLCVDQFNDNHYCGGCSNDCTASNQVCAGGVCAAPGVSVNPGGKSCPGGGPPILLNNGSTPKCAGLLAQTTFRWGLCACGDVSLVDSGQPWGPAHPGLDFPALYIDAYDSSKGPWDPNNPELGGSLGINGTFSSAGNSQNNASGTFTFITGNWWSASSIDTGGPTDVKQELHAAGPITTTDRFDVGQPDTTNPVVSVVPGTAAWDGYVTGNISTSGAPMTFYKDLYSPSGANHSGVVIKGITHNASVSVPPPCDSCGGSQVPVASYVDYFANATNNDNAAIGLSPSAMSNLSGTTRLDLPCGYYYLDQVHSLGNVTIYAHGHTALFIGGDATAAVLSFTLDPTGSFDVFVKGTIQSSSDLVIGNPNYAALSRTYVAGSMLGISGEAHISGLFFAANSDINLSSHITAYGALYCKSFVGMGDNTDIHYDRASLRLDKECCDPNISVELGGCPGTVPPGCTSCKDCGNQACVGGACGACTSSAQCCPPLVCQGGSCVAPLQ